MPETAARLLEGAGFAVAGVLPIGHYDAFVPMPWQSQTLLPSACTAIVLGTAGGRFESSWLPWADRQGRAAVDPADDLARGVVSAAAGALAASCDGQARGWLYADQQGEPAVFADFVGLARLVGLGAPSRFGLLLHPEFGPWWSVRALILTTWEPSSVASKAGRRFDACTACAAPCVEACPGNAVTPSGFDAARCGATRLSGPPCAERCDARRACVVGPAHGYPLEAESYYAARSLEWLIEARDRAREG